LYGKIVDFDMNIYDVIKKINEIQELSLEHKTKYEFKEIWANKTFGGTYKVYIIL